jgi:hypothetical protein
MAWTTRNIQRALATHSAETSQCVAKEEAQAFRNGPIFQLHQKSGASAWLSVTPGRHRGSGCLKVSQLVPEGCGRIQSFQR